MLEALIERLPHLLIQFPVLLFAMLIHEVAHGGMALFWGDPTARQEGRLTLNPGPHIDFFGTILFPLISLLLPGSPIFGWAKPVPIQPRFFRNYRWGMITVALAGPFANFLLGFFSAGFCSLLTHWGSEGFFLQEPFLRMGYASLFLNFFIGFFNLVPLPPLDGSKVLATLLPYESARRYEAFFGAYQFYIFLALLWVGAFRLLQYPTLACVEVSVRFFEGIFG